MAPSLLEAGMSTSKAKKEMKKDKSSHFLEGGDPEIQSQNLSDDETNNKAPFENSMTSNIVINSIPPRQ